MKQVILITVEERQDTPAGSLYRQSLLASLKQACANSSTKLDIKMHVEKVATVEAVEGHT